MPKGVYIRSKRGPQSEETKRKISEAQKGKPRPYQRGDKHGMWKGEDVTYQGIHSWFRDKKASQCHFCGAEERLELALRKGFEHARHLHHYYTLCVPCHRKYDAHEAWNKGNKAVYPKLCEFCGVAFNGVKKRSRFCSASCSAKHRMKTAAPREKDPLTGRWLAIHTPKPEQL